MQYREVLKAVKAYAYVHYKGSHLLLKHACDKYEIDFKEVISRLGYSDALSDGSFNSSEMQSEWHSRINRWVD